MTAKLEAHAGVGVPSAESADAVRLPAFILATLAWLVPAFAVWYFAAPIVVAPAVWLARLVALLGLHDVVQAIEQTGSSATFVTSLRAATADARGVVTVDVNTLLYAFGMPLFAALTLAAREPSWKRHLAVGYVVMLPFVAWGILAEFLKNIAITAGPAIASQAGFAPWQREAIAFAYQFGSLILPAVVPAVLWVALHGAFIARLRSRASPSGSEL
ncbi:MAG TPA: exosortase H-associated membrane protein [Casimicrobiaceae bacterium]